MTDAKMTLEIVGGLLGSNIGPELADAGSRSLARIAKELTGELLEAPGDSVKFARLIKEGKVDEAYKAVRDNLIDDAGDVAGAAKFDEFRQRIIKAAAYNGLTEEQQLKKELAQGIVAETVELYNPPEHGRRDGGQARTPVPFSLILDDEYAEFLRVRITEGSGLSADKKRLSLSGLDGFLNGYEPTEDEYEALSDAFGEDFAGSIRQAVEKGLLHPD